MDMQAAYNFILVLALINVVIIGGSDKACCGCGERRQ